MTNLIGDLRIKDLEKLTVEHLQKQVPPFFAIAFQYDNEFYDEPHLICIAKGECGSYRVIDFSKENGFTMSMGDYYVKNPIEFESHYKGWFLVKAELALCISDTEKE